MASSKSTSKKKTASTAKKSRTPAKKPAASSAARSSPPPAPQPVRREVWGVVFLFLAVFMVISHYNTDGAFIAFFSAFSSISLIPFESMSINASSHKRG